MFAKRTLAAMALMAAPGMAAAQQLTQPDLRIDSANRTLSVSATETVTVDPDLAILHVGFDTQPEDAKSAYADGARISSAIIAAVKQAGIPESSIQSQSQYLNRDSTKPHKFTLSQQWTVRAAPERAAEILDIAIGAGATSSGEIEWTVKDEKGLADEALAQAAARARREAEVLAKGMEVRLGALIYVSNQLAAIAPGPILFRSYAASAGMTAPQTLAVEPHKVTREATVHAVFAIE